MPTALYNARIFDGTDFQAGHAVILDQGVICEIVPEAELPAGIARLDLDGTTLAPGFVDTQVNGGGGMMFNDCREVGASAGIAAEIAAVHRRFGTTSLLATLISDAPDHTATAAKAIAPAIADPASGIIGIHFEGPFLNAARRGVHGLAYIRAFDAAEVECWNIAALGRVVMTVAPECLPAGALAALRAKGIRLSAGHSLASYEEGRAALAAGLSGFTHLFNAMPQMQSRAPGLIAAGLEDADSWCGLIVDGHHVHPAMLRLALARKAAGKMMLVSDAMACVGTAQTEFELQGNQITIVDGRCANQDGTLAGSNLSMIDAVRNTVELLELPLGEALRMASLYPADFLGLGDRLGRIQPGYRCDLVAFDSNFQVRRSWIHGEIAQY